MREALVGDIRQEKEIEGIQTEKAEGKLLLFADDMILYLKDPMDSTKTLKMINNFSKPSEDKSIYKTQQPFYRL